MLQILRDLNKKNQNRHYRRYYCRSFVLGSDRGIRRLSFLFYILWQPLGRSILNSRKIFCDCLDYLILIYRKSSAIFGCYIYIYAYSFKSRSRISQIWNLIYRLLSSILY